MNTPEEVNNLQERKEQNIKRQRLVSFIDAETQRGKTPPTIYTFRDLYKEKKGEDLLAYYEKQKTTSHGEKIKNDFLKNVEIGGTPQLAEKLPLLANKKGRLGEYVQAKVTKTLKQDDQGNSFIDFVMELTNDYAGEVDEEAPRKITLLVDVGTTDGDRKKGKEHALQKEFLDKALKANVKCYYDGFTLGIERPKILATQDSAFMKEAGDRLGSLVVTDAKGNPVIPHEEKFDAQYREYFKDLMRAVRENALANIVYMRKFRDGYHFALTGEYEKIARFADAYEKTPLHRIQK